MWLALGYIQVFSHVDLPYVLVPISLSYLHVHCSWRHVSLSLLQSRDPPPPPSAAEVQWNYVISALKNKKKYARLKHRLTGADFNADMSKDILHFILAQDPIEIESLRVALQVR